MAKTEVPLRAVIEAPPPGVQWALQLSKGDLSDLAAPVEQRQDQLVFEFTVRAETTADGGVRLLGAGVQGPPHKRFFYLNSGTLAGQADSCWCRRAKIPLTPITAEMVRTLKPGQVLEVHIVGTGKRGGPVCAGVTLLPPGWAIV